MSKPGSHDHAAAIAARRGLEAGLTRLGIALLTHVASRGVNFQTDEQVRGEISRPDGRPYHRESIGRKRRELARSGLVSARRYFPGQRPPGARFRTPHGVVATAVLWAALRESKAPTLRGARAAERAHARALSRPPSLPAPMSAAETLAAIDTVRRTLGPPKPPAR